MFFDPILRSNLVGFSLLCASDYYGRKGTVCYVLTFYSQYSYGELSIFSYLFYRKMHLLRFICCYCTFIHNTYIIFIMFYLKSSRNLVFLTYFESIPLCYFQTHFFAAEKLIPNLPIFDHPQRRVTTERQSPITVWLIVVRDISNQI